MAAPNQRPLSPHLSIWRWGPHMTVSILHRVTGGALAVAGLALLTWWLSALAGGTDSYDSFAQWVWGDFHTLSWSGGAAIASLVKVLFKVLLLGLTWALYQHLLSGLRHLVMDTGAGFELPVNKTMAIFTIVGSLVLTLITWFLLLGGKA